MNEIANTISFFYQQICSCKRVTCNQSYCLIVAHIITYSWFRRFGPHSRPTRHKSGVRLEEFRYHNVEQYLYPSNKKLLKKMKKFCYKLYIKIQSRQNLTSKY